jgi:large subunit ribosomal protein L25
VPEVRIAAEPRTEFGKGGARRTRRAGKIPAVLYGHGSDPRHISVPTRDFENALRTDGANVLLDLQLADGSELALPKSIQRDPVSRIIEHLDLILVRRGERMSVEIPIQLEGTIAGGGMLEQSLTTLSVTAEATNIPSGVTISIDGLEIGTSVHASEVKLPEGVEIDGDSDALVFHVVAAPTAEQMESEGAGEGEAAGGETASASAEGGESATEGGSEESAAE